MMVHLYNNFMQQLIYALRCKVCTSRLNGVLHPFPVKNLSYSRRICYQEFCGVMFCGFKWWEDALPLNFLFEFPMAFWERDKMVC